MTREEFLNALEGKLSQLSPEEIRSRREYYGELLSDMQEDGMTEAEAVEKLGSPEEIAGQILGERSQHIQARTGGKPGKGWSTTAIVLTVIGAPLWVPLAIAAVSVVGSLYLTVWALVLSLYVLVFVLGLGGLVMLAGSVSLFMGSAGAALGFLGLGLLSLALCCVGIPGVWYLTLGIVRGTGLVFGAIKKLFIR